MREREFGEGNLPDTENGNFPNFELNNYEKEINKLQEPP